MKGWESVHCGGCWFLVAWFQSVLVSWFLGFVVSWFLGVKVFLVSKFQRFKDLPNVHFLCLTIVPNMSRGRNIARKNVL